MGSDEGDVLATTVHGFDDSSAAPGADPADDAPAAAAAGIEASEWLRRLHAHGSVAEEALEQLHGVMLRAARFEAARRRPTVPDLSDEEVEEIARAAAVEAAASAIARLDEFRGVSRFTTWASKFALTEVSVKLRRRAWEGRRLPTESARSARRTPSTRTLERAIARALTPSERRVVVALALDGVPIDVLAERLQTTRGAVYATLQHARRKLRPHVLQPVP
jgi:RNA polymerase sigma-70 factor (ECF subfamily)